MSTDAVFRAVFAHAGPWSEEDYLAIPETPARIELASGVLVVNALPDTYHQRLVRRFGNLLEQTCPTLDWEVYEGLNVRLWPEHVRIPDVVVARAGFDARIVPADKILVLAEITSPSNFRQDRIVKHGEYAEAGIPFYVRIDLHLGVDGLTASAYELVDGVYEEIATRRTACSAWSAPGRWRPICAHWPAAGPDPRVRPRNGAGSSGSSAGRAGGAGRSAHRFVGGRPPRSAGRRPVMTSVVGT